MLLGTGKSWPIADQRAPCNDPGNDCGTHFGSGSFSFPKWWIEVRLFKVHIIINFFSLQDDLIVDDDDLLNDDDDDLLDD